MTPEVRQSWCSMEPGAVYRKPTSADAPEVLHGLARAGSSERRSVNPTGSRVKDLRVYHSRMPLLDSLITEACHKGMFEDMSPFMELLMSIDGIAVVQLYMYKFFVRKSSISAETRSTRRLWKF